MSLEQQHRALATSPHAGYGEGGALQATASGEGLQAPGNTQYLAKPPPLEKDRPEGISKVWVSWVLSEVR